jgi:hypothetical protein
VETDLARDARLRERDDELSRLKERVADHSDLERRLLDAEQRLAGIPALERDAERARAERDVLRTRLQRAQAVTAAMQRSLSWRLTRPLRAAKRRRS